MSIASDMIRVEWMKGDARRDAGLTTPEDIERFDSLRYGPTPGMNLLDVYRPKGAAGSLPVIINVHGGGWVYGDKELYQFYCMSLAQRGFAVVNYTYRLAPEWKFPAPLEDLNRVAEWICGQADTYGLDLANIFMVGDSAGGHLAALYASICTNPEYARKYNFTVPEGFYVRALGLNCGAYAPLGASIQGEQDRELMKDLLPGGGTPEEAELINATAHITKNFPAVYLMTAVGDFCRPQASLMEEALKAAGVPYRFKTYGTEEAPLYHVFHVTVQEPMGQQCNDEECAFFREHMNTY